MRAPSETLLLFLLGCNDLGWHPPHPFSSPSGPGYVQGGAVVWGWRREPTHQYLVLRPMHHGTKRRILRPQMGPVSWHEATYSPVKHSDNMLFFLGRSPLSLFLVLPTIATANSYSMGRSLKPPSHIVTSTTAPIQRPRSQDTG